MAKEVAPVAQASVPANYDYGSSHLGFENTSNEDFSIPFFGLLQSNSPLVSEDENARPGMIVNTVTGDLYKGQEGIAFIPAATQHNYIKWKDRDAGSGFVSAHDLDDPEVVAGRQRVKFGRIPSNDQTSLSETYTVFGTIVLADGSTQQGAVSFSSTKIKPYKGWMTKAKMLQIDVGGGRRIPAPLMSHRFRLTSFKDKNNKGEFFNWKITFDGPDAKSCQLAADDPLFVEAVSLNKMVLEGVAKANHAASAGTDGVSADETTDEEIPF